MKDTNVKKRKWSTLKVIAISFAVILVTAGIFVYNNFNKLLAQAVIKSFNSNIISDVYELTFEKLTVNPLEGNLRITNATLKPREKPLNDYPYINSSFRLKTEKITLKNVDIFALLKSNKLEVGRVSILNPDVELFLRGDNYVLFPFSDSTAVAPVEESTKKSINSYGLIEFQLIDANIHTVNTSKQREFKIKKFTISVNDLLISPQQREYIASFSQANLSIAELKSNLKKGPIKHLDFNDFTIQVDSLHAQVKLDTLIYRFHDFKSGVQNLDIQTTDSIFHLTMQAFDLSYKDKSIKLKALSFKPNVSQAVLQRHHQFQHAEFSGTVGTLDIVQVNFDSLIYAKKIFIDEVLVDKVVASIFKDKLKPLDTTRFPAYLGQTIMGIPLPLRINHVKATHVTLANTERIPDSTYAKVNITRATVDLKNITNLDPNGNFNMRADAYVNGKAHFKAGLTFSYTKPQFKFEGVVQKFDLPDLNALIQAYTPAKIHQGVLDELTFSGVAEKTKATGTLQFLYHDLKIDVELKEQAKWKNTVLAFAANTILASANPAFTELPPRTVQFKIARDMNKGFVNVLIKSIVNGLKETMLMSKENRKAYQEKVKEKKRNTKNKK